MTETASTLFVPPKRDDELASRVAEIANKGVEEANTIAAKDKRYERRRTLFVEVMEELGLEFAERESEVKEIVQDLEKKFVREMILSSPFYSSRIPAKFLASFILSATLLSLLIMIRCA